MAIKNGQIIARGAGRWLVSVSQGRDGETGRRKYLSHLCASGEHDGRDSRSHAKLSWSSFGLLDHASRVCMATIHVDKAGAVSAFDSVTEPRPETEGTQS